MLISDSLPIHTVLPELLSALRTSNRIILQAPPGAGKTTAVPLSILNEPWLEGKTIVMLEPRRLAARSAASRMAEMLGEKVGERVGYQIRGEKKLSAQTRIVVVTEGILTRWLQNDPSLEETAIIIFDEFHERSLHADLSLAFALQSQECLREDLKVLVMSATLDTRGLAELLDDPPILQSEGRAFAVEIVHLPPTAVPLRSPREILEEAYRTVIRSLSEDEGDILVFLPGEKEIRSLEQKLRESVASDIRICPLYGALSRAEQLAAILPSTQRKIVLATNIAETSLTIEGIRIVVDAGLERASLFDAQSGMERLITRKISRASADQRSGRAGRLSEGKCYRLWSRSDHDALLPHRPAEITQSDLTPLALELCAWGAEPHDLRWIDPPKASAFAHARDLLHSLGAIDGILTPHGEQMLGLGLHPRLAHMVLRAKAIYAEEEAVILAALLVERDIAHDHPSSDLSIRYALAHDALIRSSPPSHLHTFIQNTREISQRLGIKTSGSASVAAQDHLGLLLSFAYPDRIARSRGNGRFLTAGGKEVILRECESHLRDEWIVVARSDGDATSSRIHLYAPIGIDTLRIHHKDAFCFDTDVTLNPESGKVVSRETERLGAITIASRPVALTQRESVHRALLEGIAQNGLSVLEWPDTALALQRRLNAHHRHFREAGFGDFSDDALLSTLETWLLPHLGDAASLKECAALEWHAILVSALTWEQQRELDRLFPSHYEAPTGSRIPIDYADPDAPVLSVRIQEIFGLSTHPAVLEGRLPLTVHLLSPAQRPIQMTRDLVGFWRGSYGEVKKELKGRYPKHYWPDDPATAQATKKTKKFMGV